MARITRDDVLNYIEQHPGATNREVAEFFKYDPSSFSGRMKYFIDGGYLIRKVVGRLPSGVDYYGYWVNKKVTPVMNKPERKATVPVVEETLSVKKTVRERQDNGEIAEMIQSLGNSLAKQIAAQVMLSLQASLHRELSAVIPEFDDVEVPKLDVAALLPAPVITPKAAAKTKQLKIAVIGLLGPQAGLISTEFGQHFDLTFWNNDGQNRLKSLGIGSDLVLVTKWCSHSTTETLKNIGAKWRKINGGLDEVRSVLTEMFIQEN